jgi:hypothetical protein
MANQGVVWRPKRKDGNPSTGDGVVAGVRAAQEVLDRNGGGPPLLSVCCLTSGRAPERLRAILSLFDSVADEIVVAVDETAALPVFDTLAAVADRVLTFPHRDPGDRPIPWLFQSCAGRWIFNVDDDEIPSPRLLKTLHGLVRRDDITHAWIARRWLYPTMATHLDQPPWSTEYQLRLLLSDPRFLQFSDVFHRPVVAHGPGLYVQDPLWHLDTTVRPYDVRAAKAAAYERERPGMRIGALAHNSALYLPELQPDLRLTGVPADDRAVIDSVVVGETMLAPRRSAQLIYASDVEIDSAWPGEPGQGTAHRGTVTVGAPPGTMRAGMQETVDVQLRNDSDRVWRWGKDARPEIRLGYRWSACGAQVWEPSALRTPLPADLRPGETQVVPVHVVPPEVEGRYDLEIALVHEGVCWFAPAAAIAVDVVGRDLVALVGAVDHVVESLAMLGAAPHIEPVVIRGCEGGYGDYRCADGVRGYLLEGVDSLGRLHRAARLALRTARIERSARRYRRGRTGGDPRCTAVLGLLSQARALVVAGPDWPADAAAGREWAWVVATVRAARALGTPIYYGPRGLPTGSSAWEKRVRRLIERAGAPLVASEPRERPTPLTPAPARPETPRPVVGNSQTGA